MNDMIIKNATIDNLEEIVQLEHHCFPKNEAASITDLKDRLNHYPNHFWLLYEDDTLVSLIDGLCTNIKELNDEMFHNASMHDENGEVQMILSVCTHPDYRKKGYSSTLMRQVISDSKKQKRKSIVLTCKTELLDFYSKLGFVDEGLSESNHGDESWNQVRLMLD